MKYIIPILLFLAPLLTRAHLRDTVPSGVPQLFGGKYYKYNGYVLVDSFIMNAAGDTNNIPYFPSLKFKSSDNKWYGWDRSRWSSFITKNLENIQWCNLALSGADTTGTNDVSPYINNLINSGCRYIYIPKGKYLIASTIQLRDSIVIKGDGRQNSIIKLTTNIPAFKTSYSLGGQRCEFHDLTFLGTNGSGGDTRQVGILMDSTSGSLIENVAGYQMGGFTIRIKNNGFCCAMYTANAVRGNTIANCYFQACYGGIALDTLAEYNSVINSIAVNGTYGVFVAGGNNRVNDNSFGSNTYGLYCTGGANNAHGVAVGNTINHNNYNIYVTGASNGFTFSANACYAANTQEVYIDNSDNVNFYGGAILTGKITSINNTNCTFSNVRMSGPVWTITGTAPTVVTNGEIQNTISIKDVANSNQFNIRHTNKVVNLDGDIKKIRIGADSIVFSTNGNHYIAGGENSNDTLNLLSTFNPTVLGGIKFGFDIPASGIKAGLWNTRNGFVGIGTLSPQQVLQIRNSRPNFNSELSINEDTNCASCSARITLNNNGSVTTGQIFVGATSNAFMPRGMLVHTSGTDGLKIATNGGNGQDIEFAGSVTFGVSTWGRFKGGTGNFLYNTTTDNATTGKFQIHSTSRFDSLMRLYNVAAPGATYNLIVHNLNDSGLYQIPTSALTNALTLQQAITNGSTLSSVNTIVAGNNSQTLTGTQAAGIAYTFSNSGNGTPLAASANGSGIGLNVSNSGSGIAVFGSGTGGIGGYFTSTNNLAIYGRTNPASTNVVTTTLMTGSGSSGTTAVGFGNAWDMQLEDNGGVDQTGSSLRAVLTDASTGAISSEFQAFTSTAGALTQKFTLKHTGQVQFNVGYGSNSFSGTPISSIQTDASGNLINGPLLASGTYTPTLTNGTNIAASTAYPCQYMRVGNTVTVSGKVDIDPTSATATVLGISLPIASAFSNDYESGGTASAGIETYAGSIRADATNDRVQMDFVIPASGSTANTSWFFSFTYQIL